MEWTCVCGNSAVAAEAALLEAIGWVLTGEETGRCPLCMRSMIEDDPVVRRARMMRENAVAMRQHNARLVRWTRPRARKE
jgi:hypothetical protein